MFIVLIEGFVESDAAQIDKTCRCMFLLFVYSRAPPVRLYIPSSLSSQSSDGCCIDLEGHRFHIFDIGMRMSNASIRSKTHRKQTISVAASRSISGVPSHDECLHTVERKSVDPHRCVSAEGRLIQKYFNSSMAEILHLVATGLVFSQDSLFFFSPRRSPRTNDVSIHYCHPDRMGNALDEMQKFAVSFHI